MGLLCAATLMLPACRRGEPGEAAAPPSGAVAASTPEAAAAGIHALALGGNAVDAAVAVSLALGASEPSESGLGGSVVMLIAPRDGDPVVVHAAPGALGASGPAAELMRPTALPVLVHAWKRYGSGKVAWEQLVEPARRIAQNGFALGRFRHRMLISEYRRLQTDSLAASLVLNPDHSIPGEGTVVRFPALAATLDRLAGTDPDDLSGGEIERALASELRETTGAAASALAASAAVREDPPLRGTYRGWTVLVPAAPYAGDLVLRALAFLETAPVAVLRRTDEVRSTWMAEALGYATAKGAALTSYVQTVPPLPVALDSVRRSLQQPARRPATPLPPPQSSDTTAAGAETSHFSVVDGAGTAVSVTQTLGGPFGGRATGLGFFLGRFPSVPPAPPSDSTAGAPAEGGLARPADPWTEPASWAVPTVLVRDGLPGLVLGSAGGPRAVSAVVQVVSGWVDAGRSLREAVAAPRMHVERDTFPRPRVALEGVVWIDPASQPALALWGAAFRQVAVARGFRLGEAVTGLEYLGMSPYFGGLNAVAREGDAWVGVADPRRDGEGRTLSDEDLLRARDGSDLPRSEPEPAGPPPPSRRPSAPR